MRLNWYTQKIQFWQISMDQFDMRRPLTLAIDSHRSQPLFLQIARTVRERILSGQLLPGDRLPGSRRLAHSLAVHRNTVLAAFEELIAEGWLETRQGGGTYVSKALPPIVDRDPPRAPAHDVAYALPEIQSHARVESQQPGVLDLSKGIPDTRLLPVAPVAAAFRRVMQQADPSVLAYGDPQGQLPLRDALSRHLNDTRGLAVGPEGLIITRGSQQALDLVFRLLLRPGDRVAVEELGYPRVHAALRHAGVQLVPIPVDDKGLQVEVLATKLQNEPIRALYVTPHHQYPTMATLTADRRLQLLELARQHRLPVIEDDYDHEFHYDGPPILPVASLDKEGVVIYLGTLSKILAPGLRIGYVAGPSALIARLCALRQHVDICGEPVVQLAAADLLITGDAQRFTNKTRRLYQARRDTLAHALRQELGDWVSFHIPTGGLGLWVQVDPTIDVDHWETAALQEGVAILAGRRLAVDGHYRSSLRLVFSALQETELQEAVRRMRRVLPI